ncbi:MAG: metallophosphoesterase family protein [Bacillota bacterium]|nr:metallophosphoesterase family protein [Bacillota bacterium]
MAKADGEMLFHRVVNKIFTQWVKRARVPGLLLTALAGALLAAYLAGGMRVDVQGLTLRVSALPALHGRTVLDLSPLGQVSAATHRAPVQFRIGLEQISMDTIKNGWIDKSGQERAIGIARERMPEVIINLALREVAAGFAGAALLVFLLWRPRLRTVLAAGAGGAFLVAAVLTGAGLNYNVDAFREPHFEGPVAMAPGAIKMVNDSLTRLDEVKDLTGQVVSNIKDLFTNINSLMVLGNPGREKETRAILLVSDLHSNPIGVEFIRTLSYYFRIDFIVNAGDITDFGSPLEAEVVEGLKDLSVPHVFLAGNHDTPEITSFIAGIKDSYVLNGETLELKGLRILGIPDPLSTSGEVEIRDRRERDLVLNVHAESLRAAVREQGRPDILVVHNEEVARRLLPEAPLVVAGHTHRPVLEKTPEGALINPGTTGAAGLRGFYSEGGAAYSAAIVYVRPEQGPLAADVIKYDPLSARFSLDRQLIEPEAAAYLANSPAGPPER